ncbi:MAG: alpha-amylase family glycosyl hydrolase [Chitinophagaceae bacterium]
MKKYLLFILIFIAASGQAADKINVYPTHWWAGMKNPNLQLMIHADRDIAVDKLAFSSSSKDVKVVKVTRAENPHYIFVDLLIAATARPQTVTFSFGGIIRSEWHSFSYELKARSKENGRTRVQGVTSRDLIYLLMPDRFSNGDPSNDFFPDMRDTGHDRNNPFDRHGGDLQGVTNHLDYLNELGVTAIWMTPVVENNMSRTLEGGTSRSTYHGYAFTDQYTIDKRLGGDAAYKNLINAAHAKGMKIIQDAVYNHVGNDHWSVRDLPMKDWLNQWPSYQNTSYKDQPLVDPYASAIDKKITLDGWFTPFLADLNQRNPFVAAFLIQYAVWATEEYGIDGWRVDTYFYNDPLFLNKVNEALLREFPAVTVFGETSVQSVINGAYFCENNMNVPFRHNCQGITDFPLYSAVIDALKQPYGWNEGVNRLYQVLAQDVLYKNPMRNCIFLGNHDLDRMYSVIGEDFDKYKMGMNFLLTLRGIPQLYYGDEVLMKNFKDPTDAEVRKDFPGGWPDDKAKDNLFNREGRNDKQEEAFRYLSSLAQFRKSSSALTTGKLMQYVPSDGLYIYFRYDAKQTVMVISNTGSKKAGPDWTHYAERVNGFTRVRNVISGKIKPLAGLTIDPGESHVYELIR